MTDRRAEIEARLGVVRQEIAQAAVDSGRSAEDVTLIVVTKTKPASDVQILADLGVTEVGENRDQEAREKHDECADLALQWNFIGQLQTNKCPSVASYADRIHSVDRVRLVNALSKAVVARRAADGTHANRQLECLVQVNLDPMAAAVGSPGHRGGAQPGDVTAIAAAIAQADGLRLGGVMAVAPLGEDPRPAFDRLREVSGKIADEHPSATIISAGMSGDFVAAIKAGATHVRMGAAVLGHRPTVR
ncbi:MAG: YggS family pyridoxal phosphate-dependent enzyme [Candidatus Nanopelagicales bacterium]